MVGNGYVRANRDRGPQRESASRPFQRIPANSITPAFGAALYPARAESRERVLPRANEHWRRGVRLEQLRAGDGCRNGGPPRGPRIGEHGRVWRWLVAARVPSVALAREAGLRDGHGRDRRRARGP